MLSKYIEKHEFIPISPILMQYHSIHPSFLPFHNLYLPPLTMRNLTPI